MFLLETRLGVLLLELNKLLIIVVVLSMALTPLLNEVGRWAADFVDDNFDVEEVCFYTMMFILEFNSVIPGNKKCLDLVFV